MSTYAEKASAGYGNPSYAVPTYEGGEYYRAAQPFVTPAYPQGHVAYGTTQTFGTAPSYTAVQQQGVYGYPMQQDARTNASMTAFNPGAPPPNFARPPPAQIGKGDENYQGGGLSIFEANAQSSTYTANWGTSSVAQMVEFGQWNNPDQGADSGVTAAGSNVYAQATAATVDQFAKMNVGEQPNNMAYDSNAWGNASAQQPIQQHQQGQGAAQIQQAHNPQQQAALAAQHWPSIGAANEKSAKDRKREERRQREEPRELTWEERLRKAQGAKDRAENPKFFDRGSSGERGAEVAQGDRGAIRGGGSRGRGVGGVRGAGGMHRGGKSENGAEMGENYSGQQQSRDGRWNGQRRMAPQMAMEGDGQHMMMPPQRLQRGGMMPRGGGVMPMPPMQPMHPMMFRGGPPPQGMMPPPAFIPAGAPMAPMLPAQAQDQRFRNSWLDANLFVPPFPVPFSQMGMSPMLGGAMRGRGRGRGVMVPRGRGGRRMPNGKESSDAKPADGETSEEEKHLDAEEVDDEEEHVAVDDEEADEVADASDEDHVTAFDELSALTPPTVEATESNEQSPVKESEEVLEKESEVDPKPE